LRILASSATTKQVIRHPIRVHDSPLPRRTRSFSDDAGGDNIIYSAEDRYYTSSAPSGNRRPDFYRASQF
uniref:Movement protein n=1 Tax=Angiostrongylus cantonensis TaxID=6313 RepID=A0A0K0DJ40_ANGCA